MPLVSVILPCFNQGHTVLETVDSVLRQSYDRIELIIVDDGSDQQDTIDVLDTIAQQNVKLVRTSNQGLAAARNNGIAVSQGKYILPLDSDDLIEATYIEKAVTLLENDPDLGIIYCRAQLFGAVDTEWLLPPYSFEQMLLDNIIFCSALYRRSDWEAVGGYDSGMVHGWEDYDFWLSLIERGREVYQIPEILFFYRVNSDSMVRSKQRWQKTAMLKRIFSRHEKLFTEHIEVWINALLDVREKYYSSKLYVDCGNGISDEQCLSRKVDISTSEIQFSLKEYENIQSIRFDPIDAPAIVEINKIVLIEIQGEVRELEEFSDNSIFRIENNRYFETDDSQCFFSLTPGELSQIETISVQLNFKALADDALKEIIRVQKDRLHARSEQEVSKFRSAIKLNFFNKKK